MTATTSRASAAPLRPSAAVAMEIASTGRNSSGTWACPKAASDATATSISAQTVRTLTSRLRPSSLWTRKRMNGATISMPRPTVVAHEVRKSRSNLADSTPATPALSMATNMAEAAKRMRFIGRASSLPRLFSPPIR